MSQMAFGSIPEDTDVQILVDCGHGNTVVVSEGQGASFERAIKSVFIDKRGLAPLKFGRTVVPSGKSFWSPIDNSRRDIALLWQLGRGQDNPPALHFESAADILEAKRILAKSSFETIVLYEY